MTGSVKRGTAVGKKAPKSPDRKEGTPTTGIGTGVMVRFGEPLLERLDIWCAKQAKETSRADAIRHILEEMLPQGPKLRKKMATS